VGHWFALSTGRQFFAVRMQNGLTDHLFIAASAVHFAAGRSVVMQ
jgi:hypothetical protein